LKRVPTLGMKLDGIPTEEVVSLAREVERHGLDSVWVCEDLGRNGGIAQAALCLGATERCQVGLGIMPAAVRNVAYLAMELASLCRAHPSRFLPGLGHGMPEWLEQVGARPASLLDYLDGTTVVVKRLLAGETVSFDSGGIELDSVTLGYPPPHVPPILWGVRGPKGVELAARVADGLILAEGSGPGYGRRSRRRVGEAATIVVFAWLSIGRDASKAIGAIRPTVATALGQDFMRAQIGELGFTEPVDAAIDELSVAGDVETCAAAIKRLYAAGADSVVLQPIPGTEYEQLAQLDDLVSALG
jgi:alkanesulfonate monooxygenase SsuD/methylene tetrahydromethanopterin reductase-like flavin-dependent oxidoreductase (luciferase family)